MTERPHLCDCNSEQCHAPYYNRYIHEGDECVHVDGTRHKIQRELIRVRYKFKDEDDFITITVTEGQYNNLREVLAIEKCEIVGSAQKPISEQEKIQFNHLILVYCQTPNKTKYLL